MAEKISEKRGRPARAINAGVAGQTSTDALRRLPALLGPGGAASQNKNLINDLVIQLGINDLLQHIPPETTGSNYRAIVQLARAHNPAVRLFIFQIPTDWLEQAGLFAAAQLSTLIRSFAEEESVQLLPCLLNGVLGHPEYCQADGIHPNPDGQAILTRNVWQALSSHF